MKRALKLINYAPYVDVEDFVLQSLAMAWTHVPSSDLFDADVRVGVFHESLRNCRPLRARPLGYQFEMDSAEERMQFLAIVDSPGGWPANRL
jgi:hypothetical protein